MLTVHEMCPMIPEECDAWLTEIGYYNKPASLYYHGKRSGDLYRHCVEVANQLQKMTDKLGLKWQRTESPTIVGLLHDVCKCDDYIMRGRVWIANRRKLDGHGEKSVEMLKDHIELTPEELMCIQYHMGAFVDKEQWKWYTKAVQDYPNVLYTHTADMIASQVLGI